MDATISVPSHSLAASSPLGAGVTTGPKKAICAVAASILTAAYHMLKDGTFYQDLGADHFNRRRPDAQARRLLKRLASLGFSVELKPLTTAS